MKINLQALAFIAPMFLAGCNGENISGQAFLNEIGQPKKITNLKIEVFPYNP